MINTGGMIPNGVLKVIDLYNNCLGELLPVACVLLPLFLLKVVTEGFKALTRT